MSNQTLTTPFPATLRDVALLKQTAIDAASDLSSTATVHALKAKEQLKDLAGHVQEEGSEQLSQVKVRAGDLLNVSREFVSSNPVSCIAAALTIGFILGFRRRYTKS